MSTWFPLMFIGGAFGIVFVLACLSDWYLGGK